MQRFFKRWQIYTVTCKWPLLSSSTHVSVRTPSPSNTVPIHWANHVVHMINHLKEHLTKTHLIWTASKWHSTLQHMYGTTKWRLCRSEKARLENAKDLTSLFCSNCMYLFHSSSFTGITQYDGPQLEITVSIELPIAEAIETRDNHKQIEK